MRPNRLPGLTRRALLGSSVALGGAGLMGGCGLTGTAVRQGFLAGEAKNVPFGVRSFVRRAFEGLNRRAVWDMHVHIVGNGASGSGAWVNPAYREELYKSFLYDLYMASGGVFEDETADEDYIARTLKLHRLANSRGKLVMFAFDYAHDEQGKPDKAKSQFYVPNAFAQRVAAQNKDVEWAASIHPYRPDALDALDQAIDGGAIAVKWLPNAQVFDPSSPRLDAFYKKLVDNKMVLVVHGGEEQAADSAGSQAYGNVLLLRRPLDLGVRVVVAHCAGLGKGEDLDQPEGSREEVESFDLMMRLLEEERYEDNLFADISAMTQFNRAGRPLHEIIKATHLHPRLVNGSDYPLPSIDFLVSTRFLEKLGYLSKRDRQFCNAVFDVNPLLYDFVVKRSLRVREGNETYKLSDVVFESRRIFPRAKVPSAARQHVSVAGPSAEEGA